MGNNRSYKQIKNQKKQKTNKKIKKQKQIKTSSPPPFLLSKCDLEIMDYNNVI